MLSRADSDNITPLSWFLFDIYIFWQRVTSSQRMTESSVLDAHASEVSFKDLALIYDFHFGRFRF